MDSLSGIRAFSALDASERAAIAPLFSSQTFVRNQTLITHGERNSSVFFLMQGRVRATMYSPSGREIAYQDIEQGEMLGELSAIDQQPRSTHVISLSSGEMLILSREHFNHLMEHYPAFAHSVLLKMAGLVRYLCDRVYEYAALSVSERLRAELVRMIQQQKCDPGQPIVLSNMPTHEELASRIATHREAVTRELGHLEKNGILTKKRNQLTVMNLNALMALTK